MDGGQIWVGWRSSILGHSGRILGEYAAAGSVDRATPLWRQAGEPRHTSALSFAGILKKRK